MECPDNSVHGKRSVRTHRAPRDGVAQLCRLAALESPATSGDRRDMSSHDPVPMTAAGRAALEQELEQLVSVRRPEVVRRIATTRDEGDLKENAGYHQAREDQSRLEGRILELEAALRRSVPIDEGPSNGSARLGSTVVVSDEFGESAYRLVGPTEVDAAAGRISADSPLGRALVGARAGSTVEVSSPAGPREVQVIRVD
ncbi:MAG: transcription elongation factor GreA [Candidatus Dormibacteria bacterium]